jgi:hypothetical protein
VTTSYPYLKVGKPDVRPDATTPGIRMGNAEGNYDKQRGYLPDGRVTAERSTGIDPRARNPIAPQVMPNLPP